MWSKGSIKVDGIDCESWVKHYEEPSEAFGIDGGRISKLQIRVDGKVTLNYDRGWDVRPTDELTRRAYEMLLKRYD